jgi:hypothetical protein
MRSRYWSCSKFADWLRGTAKLEFGTSKEWDEWKAMAKMRHNFRYWLAEEGLDILQKIVYYIPDKIYDVKYYINNRWITRTHALTAHPRDIKPGTWHDLSSRLLPCLFNELVEFVEVELAWSHLVFSREDRAKYNMPWWAAGWWRVRTWRCPQAGLDNLEWQRQIRWTQDEVGSDSPDLGKPTPQALAAQEILDLYKWWTEVYRNRPDPMDASGWSDYCEASRLANNGELSWDRDESPKLRKMCNKAHKLLRKIQAAYEKEDTEMMIRLIKVRHNLWT